MPSFDFCYLNADGSLACMMTACCVDEVQARVFAHAMRIADYRRFEVWRDDDLVYVRPGERIETPDTIASA